MSDEQRLRIYFDFVLDDAAIRQMNRGIRRHTHHLAAVYQAAFLDGLKGDALTERVDAEMAVFDVLNS